MLCLVFVVLTHISIIIIITCIHSSNRKCKWCEETLILLHWCQFKEGWIRGTVGGILIKIRERAKRCSRFCWRLHGNVNNTPPRIIWTRTRSNKYMHADADKKNIKHSNVLYSETQTQCTAVEWWPLAGGEEWRENRCSVCGLTPTKLHFPSYLTDRKQNKKKILGIIVRRKLKNTWKGQRSFHCWKFLTPADCCMHYSKN